MRPSGTIRPSVAVLGAGPGGCAIALHLRRAGLSVAVFTVPLPLPRFEIPETLPPAARPILAALGLNDALDQMGLRPQYAMSSAWGSDFVTNRQSICNPGGPGWFVDRNVFDKVLHEIVLKEGLPIFNARVQSVTRRRNRWQLHFDTAECQTVEATMVVDASGRSSTFAHHIGHRRLSLDRLVSVSAQASPAGCSSGEALVESASDGWWFCAPTSSGDLSVSWFTDANLLRRDDRLREGFASRLRATVHTKRRVARLLPVKPQFRSARTEWLEVTAGENWFALGDAALATDPLGSQGLLRALESAERMAPMIANESGLVPEGPKVIREIHREYLKRFLAERHYFYALEGRWSGSDFWRRRAAVLDRVFWSRQSSQRADPKLVFHVPTDRSPEAVDG